MAGQRSPNDLEPPGVSSEPDAQEVLRVWVRPDWSRVGVSLVRKHADPGVWGITLVDVARHVAKAYALEGAMAESDALSRIKALFDAEWSSPTEMPEGRIGE